MLKTMMKKTGNCLVLMSAMSTSALAHNGEHSVDFGALHSVLHAVSDHGLWLAAAVGVVLFVKALPWARQALKQAMKQNVKPRGRFLPKRF